MSDASPLTDLPSWLLTRAAARAHRILTHHLGDAGFTGYEYRVLAALAPGGARSQADIGRMVALDRRDVTHTVRGLADRGLVERGDDPTNGRVVLVNLTPDGRRAWSRLARVMETVQADVMAPLSPAETALLVDLLGRLGDESMT